MKQPKSINDLITDLNTHKLRTPLNRSQSKSFSVIKNIEDLQRFYPDQKQYSVRSSDGFLTFRVNNKVVLTKAIIK